MDTISISSLLDYLYNNFAITFVFSLVGISIREVVRHVNNSEKIRIKQLIASAVFSAILLCAVREYFSLPFSVYALICMIVGMWSKKLVRLAISNKFMTSFATNLFKRIATPVTQALSDTLKDTKTPKITDKKEDKKETEERK